MLLSRTPDRAAETWRAGVETWMIASAANGSGQLTVFEQECAPETGAPPHHHAVEEVLQVVSGIADVQVGDERQRCEPGDAVIIPAGVVHGFINSGDAPLRVLAILAAPIFEAHYVDPPRDSRRWRQG